MKNNDLFKYLDRNYKFTEQELRDIADDLLEWSEKSSEAVNFDSFALFNYSLTRSRFFELCNLSKYFKEKYEVALKNVSARSKIKRNSQDSLDKFLMLMEDPESRRHILSKTQK